MITLRIQYVLVGVLTLLAGATFAPLYSVSAQENETDTAATSTEVAASSFDSTELSTDPRERGYKVEGIPGGSEVIGDFVVGPGKVDLEMEPGQTKIVEISATNRTGVERLFKFSAEDTTGTSDGTSAVVLLGEDRGPYSLKDYVDIPEGGIMIGHNQRVRIPVRVTIPADAEPGGLYGSVLVQTLTLPDEVGEDEVAVAQSPIITRIGTLFFVTIKGDIERDGETISFGTIEDKKFFTEGPIPFAIVYDNRGTIHTTPYGEIDIVNYSGESVGFVELEPWFVMPNSLRLREVTWTRELLVGKYTATAKINRGYENVIDEFTFSFWVIPWKLTAGVFVGFFLFFFIIRFFVTHFEFKRKT